MKKPTAIPLVDGVCTMIFCAFCFLYLLVFQGDMLAYAQHVLSDGLTVYNKLVGAIIITIVLLLLSTLTGRVLARNMYFLPASYHIPSMLVLGTITDISIVGNTGEGVYGHMWITALVLFLLFLGLNYSLKNLIVDMRHSSSIFLVKNMCLNISALFVLLFLMVCTGNTDEIDHARVQAEVLNMQGDYQKAAELSDKQDFTDAHLTMMRAYSLEKCNRLGETFFEVPLTGPSSNLLPSAKNPLLMMPEKDFYKLLGGVPSPGMNVREMLRLLNKRGKINKAGRDYLLTSCLLDKDLDAFAYYMSQDSDTISVMPKHYREALTLYNHLRTNPLRRFSQAEMDTDFDDFQDLIKKNPDKTLRYSALRDTYGNTYWFYYYFCTASKALTQSVSREN